MTSSAPGLFAGAIFVIAISPRAFRHGAFVIIKCLGVIFLTYLATDADPGDTQFAAGQ
jgi:hypothetical protein